MQFLGKGGLAFTVLLFVRYISIKSAGEIYDGLESKKTFSILFWFYSIWTRQEVPCVSVEVDKDRFLILNVLRFVR